ncbi:galactosylceramide sulfotransferase [Strongylocentrotus purpuratus]|uniref:Galactosylceramide sulfotransferase-like n=1 Tax=Strongylocentrotus purpuratus TaxID=7668 RepID=A0A7M7PA01_STRPU|nr:galactosylceramide sulfotransferase [Strongylocentrotus purpuratus]
MFPIRSRFSIKKAFYIILGILFIFSLHQNGVFHAPGRFLIPEDDQYADDEVYHQNSQDFRYSVQRKSHCKPKEKVVFLKTHKTASSTAVSIIERYGFNRNFTFALSNSALKFYHAPLFSRSMVHELSDSAIGWKKADGYHMLTNHARFNKAEMDDVVHNATYFTIVRNPVDQLESAFGYFGLGKSMGFKKNDQLEEFMKDPKKHFGSVKKGYWQFAKNNQLFDLGLDHKYHDDSDVVTDTIHKLDHDFDLVMVSEYFDESVILLRRLLCWDIEDVLYISKAIRSKSHRLQMDVNLREKIQAWNKADVQLYQHFNKTLWRKIKEYGPTFQRDLDYYRTRLGEVAEECIDLSQKNSRDVREVKYVLRKGAPHYCQELLWGDVEYTRFIQRRMWDRGILLPHPKAQG